MASIWKFIYNFKTFSHQRGRFTNCFLESKTCLLLEEICGEMIFRSARTSWNTFVCSSVCRKEDDVFYHTKTKTKTKTKTDKFPGRMGYGLQVVSSPQSCIKAEMSLAHDTRCPVSTSTKRQRQIQRQRQGQRQSAQKTQHICM